MALAHSKSALQFILNPEPSPLPSPSTESPPGLATTRAFRQSHLFEKLTSTALRHPSATWRPRDDATPLVVGPPRAANDSTGERTSSVLLALVRKKRGKKKTSATATKPTRKLCSEPQCPSRAVSRGRCVRHGGGSRCTFPNCTNGAKIQTRCFQHGGSTTCMEDGCASKAKRYGYCWAHGGGRICSERACNKVAAQRGRCWAHGGGNRCLALGCTMRSYQMYAYYCKHHAPSAVATASSSGSGSDEATQDDEPME